MVRMQIAEWAVAVMERLGSIGAGLLVLIENLFPPIPSEVVLPLAGFAASRGDINLLAAILCTTAGSVIGAAILYWLGRGIGLERVRAIAVRLPLVEGTDIDRTVDWFHRHGRKAVFFGRMVPLFRSFISIPAGVDRMPMLPFVLLTAAGSGIWNTVFIGAGYWLGESWHVVERYAGVFQWIVIVAVAAALAWWIVNRVRRRA